MKISFLFVFLCSYFPFFNSFIQSAGRYCVGKLINPSWCLKHVLVFFQSYFHHVMWFNWKKMLNFPTGWQPITHIWVMWSRPPWWHTSLFPVTTTLRLCSTWLTPCVWLALAGFKTVIKWSDVVDGRVFIFKRLRSWIKNTCCFAAFSLCAFMLIFNYICY